MTNSNIRIVFMGTPEFAVAPLQAIKSAGMNIVGVVTAPDKPAGRGKKLTTPAVKVYAEKALDCPVFQPEKLKDPAFVQELEALKADLFIVVAFRMLPEMVWSLPEHGTINLHASLLPHYRGAAPINWCIINGEKETGLTTFLIDREIDTGKILLQDKMTIGRDDNAGALHDRMMEAGAALLVRTIEQVMNGTIEPVAQESLNIPGDQLKKAPRIYKEDCRIDWRQDSATIHNLVRGLSPYPGAFTQLEDSDGNLSLLKVFTTKRRDDQGGDPAGHQGSDQGGDPAGHQGGDQGGDQVRHQGGDQGGDQGDDQIGNQIGHQAKDQTGEAAPGTLRSVDSSTLVVKTGDGWLELVSLQAEGKRRMPAADFLRGFRGDINGCRVQ